MPWFADLTYWYSAQSLKGTLPERYRGEGVVQLYRDLGCGCHEHALNSPWTTEYEDVEVSVSRTGSAAQPPWIETVQWRTPLGTLEQVKQFEPLSYSWAYRQYPVRSPEDLRVLRFIYEHQYVTANYEPQRRQLEIWRDVGVCSSVPPRSPFAQLLVLWMGVSNAIYALADAPKEVEATLEVLACADDPIYEIICASPAPLVYFGENITGEVVSPRLFQRYYAPYYRRRVPQLHAAGKYIFVHLDGTMRGVLRLLAETGVDCAQSLTPYPVGDVPVSEMRQVAGPDLILWGGVPAAYFSPVYPESALRDIVMECIEHHLASAKFILCVCDQVPPDADINRVRLVSELVEQHARY